MNEQETNDATRRQFFQGIKGLVAAKSIGIFEKEPPKDGLTHLQRVIKKQEAGDTDVDWFSKNDPLKMRKEALRRLKDY